ncbi:MAG: 2OG-Fe(II) oxygenase [Novosphingobium sp.]
MGLSRPAPFLWIDNFLGSDWGDRLIAFAEEQQAAFQPSRVGASEDLHEDPSVRVSWVLKGLDGLGDELTPLVRAAMADAVPRLGLSAFPEGRLELEMAAHGDGAFFSPHIDTIAHGKVGRASNRAVTGVYYFNRQPKAFSGGELRLLPFDWKAKGSLNAVELTPQHDSLVLFPSWVPHEVLPICSSSSDFLDSRFAINCWLWKAKPE